MPAVFIKGNQKFCDPSESFQCLNVKEKRLQELIAEHPELLIQGNDPEIKTAHREMRLDTGDVDLFPADSEGLPIVVEVKLRENPQSQREVLDQILDYASSITLLTFDELNTKMDGNLEITLRSFCEVHETPEAQERAYDLLKSRFEAKVRDGTFRLIIAVDAAPNELLRAWLYENAHSRLDIRLVAVNVYRLGDGSEIISPYHLVSYKSHTVSSRGDLRSTFRDIIEAFSRKPTDGIVVQKVMATNCVILNTRWPDKVHYEFTDWLDENRIGVEIMADLAVFPDMREPTMALKPFVQARFPDNRVDLLNGGNYKGWVRLQVSYNGDVHPAKIAEGMQELIQATEPVITEELRKRGHC